MDDAATSASISLELTRHAEIRVLVINFDTKDGVFASKGSIFTQKVRDQSGTIAKSINSVQSVVNRLTVKSN